MFPSEMLSYALLIILLAYAVQLGLRWRRYRFRRIGSQPHCGNCDYDLTGNTSGTCPECGTKITAKKVVFGERNRRPLIQMVGILALLFVAINLLPGRLLNVALRPLLPDARMQEQIKVQKDLQRRWDAGKMTAQEQTDYARLLVRDRLSQPVWFGRTCDGLLGRKQYAQAESLVLASLETMEGRPAAYQWPIALLNNLLGAALAGQGKFDRGKRMALEGYQTLRDLPGVPAEAVEGARLRLRKVYEASGQPDKADQYAAAPTNAAITSSPVDPWRFAYGLVSRGLSDPWAELENERQRRAGESTSPKQVDPAIVHAKSGDAVGSNSTTKP